MPSSPLGVYKPLLLYIIFVTCKYAVCRQAIYMFTFKVLGSEYFMLYINYTNANLV